MSKLAQNDIDEALGFLEKKMKMNSPFSERESYYARSSHSGHDRMFFGMHRGSLENIFSVAHSMSDSSVMYRKVAAELEKLFIIGYALSAVYSELNETDDVMTGYVITGFYGSRHYRWLHGPFPSGWITLSDKWNDDGRVLIGWVIKSSAELKKDPAVVDAYKAYERTYNEFYSKVFDGHSSVIIPEKAAEFRVELERLHQTLKSVLGQIVQRIKEHC